MPGLAVSVAIPLPFQAPFTYRMPEGMPIPEAGVRVLVPFGARRVIGVVTGPAEDRVAGADTSATEPHAWHSPQRPTHLAASQPHSEHR